LTIYLNQQSNFWEAKIPATFSWYDSP